MEDDEIKKVFSKQLKHYLELNEKSPADLVRDLDIPFSTISNWCSGSKLPRMGKVQMLADYFGIEKTDLLEDKPNKGDEYYLNKETREIAQEIYENPDMKSLFSMSRKMPPDRLKAYLQFMKNMHDNE